MAEVSFYLSKNIKIFSCFYFALHFFFLVNTFWKACIALPILLFNFHFDHTECISYQIFNCDNRAKTSVMFMKPGAIGVWVPVLY